MLTDSLDGLVYCPGSIRLEPFQKLKLDEFREDFEINLIGAVRVMQAAIPALKAGTRPAVVLFSTVAVSTGMPMHTSSIEYLMRPAEVLAEAMCVLRPGSVFVTTFRNRWFPTKAIRIWSELHEFEREGMVTQWLQQHGFTNLHIYSLRGWPRNASDPHGNKTPYSDPVCAVLGFKPEDRR